MYEAVFNSIDDTLREDEGFSSELEYIEQTSWILFLKYLDDHETEKKLRAKADGKKYRPILEEEYRWSTWATPKTADGKLDHSKALVGNDLLKFVNKKLFPRLARFKNPNEKSTSLRYKIGEIFSQLKNKIEDGYTLRDVIGKIDKLKFLKSEDKHELSLLYESKIAKMGNAGRNGGEYYTPRPLIQAIVKVINPEIGETVYDGAVGSAGFLCEAFAWMSKGAKPKDLDILQKETFIGKEKKPLAYIIGIMNMILHGIEEPNITRINTLKQDIKRIQPSEQVDVVLANPPFGAKERKENLNSFHISTGETAYLFLQHFIAMLKPGGRCGIVIKSTFLSNEDKASKDLRKQLLEECNLFAILDVPDSTFSGTGAKTVVLFFKKGEPTKKIWYYQPNLDRNLGKTTPLNENDLVEFLEMEKTKEISENSWSRNIEEIIEKGYDLSVDNLNRVEEIDSRTPKQIIKEIEKMDKQASKAFKVIRGLL